jgi:hypothetical protein
MRYNQIKTTNQVVDEAPMNPTAFAKAIITGQDKGVQVGFEFEVLIPIANVKRWKAGPEVVEPGAYDPNSLAWIEGKTVKDLLEGFNKYGRKTWADCMNDLFKNKRSVAEQIGSSGVWSTYISWVQTKIDAANAESKSGVIKALKELMKNPKLRDLAKDHADEYRNDDTTTLKQMLLAQLQSNTGLDFTTKIDKQTLATKLSDIREALMRMYYRTNRGVDELFRNVAQADERENERLRNSYYPQRGQVDTEDSDQMARYESNLNNFTEFCNEVYGTDNLKQLLSTKWAFKGRVNNTTADLKEKLWFYVTPGAEAPASLQQRRYDSTGYMDGAEFLKANLKDSFGENMTIFRGYHQDTKKLDRWYIEPDGSLRPNDGDLSAEVVTPPLQAREAMSALKTFYSHAQQMNLYTNSSTGLHINVSIPDTLDVLKLALFVGDQHVLKTFGRQDNSYARSILKNLQQRSSRDGMTGVAPNNSIEDVERGLKEIAKNLSGDHFATVNFNGKYVSFRHAGGDYLSKLGEITNTVGRFIHAMIIASDPQMYRDEYIKKITQMVGKNQAQVTDPRVEIRSQGIPAIMIDIMALPINGEYDLNVTLQSINATLRNNYEGYGIAITKDSSARERLQGSRGFGSATKELMTSADDAAFFLATVYPTDAVQVQRIKNQAELLTDFGNRDTAFGMYVGGGSYRSSSAKAAVGTKWVKRLTQKDPAFAQAYRSIVGGTNAKTKRLPLPEQQQ